MQEKEILNLIKKTVINKEFDKAISLVNNSNTTKIERNLKLRLLASIYFKKKEQQVGMARSVWKGPFVDGHLIKKVQDHLKENSTKPIKTWSRRSTILPQFVGITFNVYNGKKFIPVLISEEMVGQKLGEYSPTRTYYGHTADKKAKK